MESQHEKGREGRHWNLGILSKIHNGESFLHLLQVTKFKPETVLEIA